MVTSQPLVASCRIKGRISYAYNQIVLVNPFLKGGVGKTTTIVSLATLRAYNLALAPLLLPVEPEDTPSPKRKRKVAFVDLDPQGNGGRAFGVLGPEDYYELSDDARDGFDPIDPDRTVNTLFTQLGVTPQDVMYPRIFTLDDCTFEVHVIPSGRSLDNTDRGMTAAHVRALDPIIAALLADNYDVFIDTRPATSYLTLAALSSATDALLPMEAGVFARDELRDTLADIRSVLFGLNGMSGLNPSLNLVGLLPTRIVENTKLSKGILSGTIASHKDLLIMYENGTQFSYIRNSTTFAEAPAFGIPGVVYAPRSTTAQDYTKLYEVICG